MGGEGLLELVRLQDAGWKGNFAQEMVEEEMSYGSRDLTLMWAALVDGNPRKRRPTSGS